MKCTCPKCLRDKFNNSRLGITLETVNDRDSNGKLCTKIVVTHPVIRKFFRENQGGGTTRQSETSYRFWMNSEEEADQADVDELEALTEYVKKNRTAIRKQLKIQNVKVLAVSVFGKTETVETSHGILTHKIGGSGPWTDNLEWTQHGIEDEWFVLHLLGLETV